MTNIQITEHALKRAKERFSWSEKALKRVAAKAWDLGFEYKQFKGKVKTYLSHFYLNKKGGDIIKIYGEIVYIFDQLRLVTLYKLPKPILKQIEKCLCQTSEEAQKAADKLNDELDDIL